MNLTILRYCQYEKIKPMYMLAEGDKFLLTAKLDKEDVFVGLSGYAGGAGGGGGMISVSYGAGGFGTAGGASHKDKNREAGLYFMRVLMNKKPMWQYTYKGFHQKGYMWYEMDYETRLLNEKGLTGVIENKIFYKSTREEQLKNYMVLCE